MKIFLSMASVSLSLISMVFADTAKQIEENINPIYESLGNMEVTPEEQKEISTTIKIITERYLAWKIERNNHAFMMWSTKTIQSS